MRLKIILLTLVSGVTALVLAQNSPNSPVNPARPGSAVAPGTPQNISPTQNMGTNAITNTNGMTGTNLSVTMIGIGTGSNVNGAAISNSSARPGAMTNSSGRF